MLAYHTWILWVLKYMLQVDPRLSSMVQPCASYDAAGTAEKSGKALLFHIQQRRKGSNKRQHPFEAHFQIQNSLGGRLDE